jgi:hypothetical protein
LAPPGEEFGQQAKNNKKKKDRKKDRKKERKTEREKERKKKKNTYKQVAGDNLQDLGLQAGSASKDLLQYGDQDMAERGADETAIDGHFRDTGGKVVAMLVLVVCDPGCQDLLQTSKRTRSEHLGAQRVGLKLLEIGL